MPNEKKQDWPEKVAEDVEEFFEAGGEEDSPTSDADAPPPPG